MLAAAFSIPAPLVNNLWLYTLFLWLVLFFGGAIVAPLTGIIITSLPQSLGGYANSITNFFCTLLGYLPAPFVYGWIKTYYSSKLAMEISMWYSFLGIFFLIFAIIFRYKNYSKNTILKRKKENGERVLQ